MAKYIIDVPDVWHYSYDKIYKTLQLKFCGEDFGIEVIANGEPYTEPDRKAIEDEVWEFTGKIQKMTCEQMHEVLGITAPNYDYFCNEISYQEAKSKYESWKAEKAEIRVGDEVILYDNVKMIVTQVDRGTSIQGVDENGECYEYIECNEVKKTGRHFDGIKDLLGVLKS